MKFTTTFTTVFYFVTTVISAAAVAMPISPRDVFAPPVTYPAEGIIWRVGEIRTVTWDTSNAPTQITNPRGKIYLRRGDFTLLDNPLAGGFDILLGQYNITVPEVPAGDNYRIVLFGDSGNWSPVFSIEAV